MSRKDERSGRGALGPMVTKRIREGILKGEYAPGEHLREVDLAFAFQVSRGPVREALAELEREGLLTQSMNRGAKVLEPTFADLQEVYSLRILLENYAVRAAVRSGTSAEFDHLADLAKMMAGPDHTVFEVTSLDIEFHRQIVLASHQRRLFLAWRALSSQAAYLLRLSATTGDAYMRDRIQEHDQLCGAIIRRDADEAAELSDRHLQKALARLIACGAYRVSPAASEQPLEQRERGGARR